MKTAIVKPVSVDVICPNCQQPLKVAGDRYFPESLSDIWDRLERQRKIACPHCQVYMIWPKNPFKGGEIK